jgi:hypothetical protein
VPPSLVDELARPAHEVGVDMGLEDVGDDEAVAPRDIEVNVDVRPRVDHGCRACGIVTDEIGRLGDAVGENLLESQRHRLSL